MLDLADLRFAEEAQDRSGLASVTFHTPAETMQAVPPTLREASPCLSSLVNARHTLLSAL